MKHSEHRESKANEFLFEILEEGEIHESDIDVIAGLLFRWWLADFEKDCASVLATST